MTHLTGCSCVNLLNASATHHKTRLFEVTARVIIDTLPLRARQHTFLLHQATVGYAQAQVNYERLH